jgi:hypothetical protein
MVRIASLPRVASPAAPQRTITKSLPAGDDAEYRSAKGTWRGPAQLQFSVGGARSPMPMRSAAW